MINLENIKSVEWITVKELIQELNISEPTLYRWIKLDKIPKPVKYINKNYFRTDDIVKMIMELFS